MEKVEKLKQSSRNDNTEKINELVEKINEIVEKIIDIEERS